MIIYLAATLEPEAYPETLERLHAVSAGLDAARPGARCVYPHGRTQEQTPEDLRIVGRRMLAGDGAIHPRATEAWAIGEGDTVAEQVRWAEHEQIPVIAPGDLLLARLAGAARAEAKGEQYERTHDIRGVDAVLRAYYDGAWGVTGTQALDYGRVGAGAYYSAAEAQVRVGLQIAQSAGIMAAARLEIGWDPRYEKLLRAHYWGATGLEAAEAAGYGGATRRARQERALRAIRKARGMIARVLRDRRDAREDVRP